MALSLRFSFLQKGSYKDDKIQCRDEGRGDSQISRIQGGRGIFWTRCTSGIDAIKNLPTILREYVILWALGTLFGVTQDVDMVTTRASSFGRFAVAVLEPEAIPTKLDVIIGNRYFQLIFEVEPFLPNIRLQSIWNS